MRAAESSFRRMWAREFAGETMTLDLSPAEWSTLFDFDSVDRPGSGCLVLAEFDDDPVAGAVRVDLVGARGEWDDARCVATWPVGRYSYALTGPDTLELSVEGAVFAYDAFR